MNNFVAEVSIYEATRMFRSRGLSWIRCSLFIAEGLVAAGGWIMDEDKVVAGDRVVADGMVCCRCQTLRPARNSILSLGVLHLHLFMIHYFDPKSLL